VFYICFNRLLRAYFITSPLSPQQVLQAGSVSEGGGGLPLRHRHWPLCEDHRSPGQHRRVGAQRPRECRLALRQSSASSLQLAPDVYEQSRRVALYGGRVYSWRRDLWEREREKGASRTPTLFVVVSIHVLWDERQMGVEGLDGRVVYDVICQTSSDCVS